MSVLARFTRTTRPLAPTDTVASKHEVRYAAFRQQWDIVRAGLERPDWRALKYGVKNTSLPLHMEQLCDALIEEDRGADALGSCAEYMLAHNVLAQLLAPCVADEPRGITAVLLGHLRDLARYMQAHFLMQQSVARAYASVVHHLAGHTCASVGGEHSLALVQLIHELCCKFASQPRLLRLYLDLGGASTSVQADSRIDMFDYLFQHLHHEGWHGYFARSAALLLLRTLLSKDVSIESEAEALLQLGRIAHAHIPEALSAAASASYALMLMPASDEAPSAAEIAVAMLDARLGTDEPARVSSLFSIVAQGRRASLAGLIDCVYLAQECLAALGDAASEAPAAAMDRLESLRADIIYFMRTAFVESVVQPSLADCMPDDAGTIDTMLHLTVLLNHLDPCGVVSRMLSMPQSDDPTLASVVSVCLEHDGPALHMALRCCPHVSRRLGMHDLVVATPVLRCLLPPPMPLSIFAAILQELQAPNYRDAIRERFFLHLREVEARWRRDAVFLHADRLASNHPHDGAPRHAQMRVVAQRVALHEHFLLPLMQRLQCFFHASCDTNVLLVDALCSLCASPFVSMEGLLAFEPTHNDAPARAPLLTFMLYMLFLQVRAFIDDIPDGAFFLSQRKTQRLGPMYHANAKSGPSSASGASPIPFGGALDARTLLDALERQLSATGWMPCAETLGNMARVRLDMPAVAEGSRTGRSRKFRAVSAKLTPQCLTVHRTLKLAFTLVRSRALRFTPVANHLRPMNTRGKCRCFRFSTTLSCTRSWSLSSRASCSSEARGTLTHYPRSRLQSSPDGRPAHSLNMHENEAGIILDANMQRPAR